MKMVKSLLLGGAAGLLAVAGAQAADLPVKAKPVQYVKICSLYGAGFYYMPGTDTCIKVGGFVRAEVNVNANGSFNPYRVQNFDTPAINRQTFRTRGGITLDARSQTEYGTLRAYLILAAMNTNGGAVGGTPYQTPFSNAAFIQFAGFTAGTTASFFEFDGQPYTNTTPYWSSAQAGNGITVFAYTAQFGNGLSATISAEDPTSRTSTVLGTPGTVASVGVIAGREWPDVVGNLRIDQAWGSAQVMGAIHEVHTYASTAAAVQENRETGYAVGAGLKLNAPMLGKGDYFLGQFTYAKGATNYLLVNSGAGGIGAFALSNGFPAVGSSAVGPVADAVYTGVGGNLDLSSGWNVTAGYEHFWNPQWRTSLYGSYGELKYTDASSAVLAALAGATAGSSADWNAYQIGSRTVWTPVANLDLSVDVIYSSIQSAFKDSTAPSATYGTFSDKNFWAGIFRVQRNFYP